jgi:hypothetical protein
MLGNCISGQCCTEPLEKNVSGILVMQNRALTLSEIVLKLCRNTLWITYEPFADTPKPVFLRRPFCRICASGSACCSPTFDFPIYLRAQLLLLHIRAYFGCAGTLRDQR